MNELVRTTPRIALPALIAATEDWSQLRHVATWIEGLTKTHSAPTVEQRLAAVRHLFAWLVTGQAMVSNPAHSIRGRAHSRRRGKTPVQSPQEARLLLDSLPANTIVGKRDRALIGLMTYTFAHWRCHRHGGARRSYAESPHVGTAS